ncbi:MAG: DUF4837 family protein [Saprospiraceae bacterium]|nr:DUF4837 family protein [Saprospiraceae bacterium]
MLRNSSILLLTILLLFSTTACDEEIQRNLRAIPTAFGPINQINVIADQDVWEGRTGDTIRFYYTSAYLILPQPEAIFDLRHFTPEQLNEAPLRKELRSYLVVADLSDDDSPTTRLVKKDVGSEVARKAEEDPSFRSAVGRDKWAKGQLVIYQFAPSEDELIEAIVEDFPKVKKRFNQADRSRIEATVFVGGEDRKLMEEVRQEMGVRMRIPSDYVMAISEDNFTWLRRETAETSSNLMMTRIPYDDQSQLSKSGIISLRDSLGREYVSSTLPNTYMKVNDTDLPVIVSTVSIDNKYALEARGIWEIENDFMGGPFISYLIHNPNREELLFVDGFVYAPGEDKRDLMQQLEFVISTINFPGEG